MRIGFATGCFDLGHKGHEHFLTECKRQCNFLVVAVNDDAYCRRVKGEGRPYDSLPVRIRWVLQFADSAIPFGGREDPLIMEIRPDVVFKGWDHSPNQTHYAARMPNWKDGTLDVMWSCTVVHIERLEGYSTTAIANAQREA
jgi:D-beta-D-heptose 7-phosphate kinase / D-beta-D-heptose 1-phosphate adenosyltransferase